MTDEARAHLRCALRSSCEHERISSILRWQGRTCDPSLSSRNTQTVPGLFQFAVNPLFLKYSKYGEKEGDKGTTTVLFLLRTERTSNLIRLLVRSVRSKNRMTMHNHCAKAQWLCIFIRVTSFMLSCRPRELDILPSIIYFVPFLFPPVPERITVYKSRRFLVSRNQTRGSGSVPEFQGLVFRI